MDFEPLFSTSFSVNAGQRVIRFGFVYEFFSVLHLIRGAHVADFLNTLCTCEGVFVYKKRERGGSGSPFSGVEDSAPPGAGCADCALRMMIFTFE
ncbi:MAG: hypothetical protein CM15mP49_07680 [Actinomycetota bacterium]|nr:MAG: hypothetical protein CM15mP49_07680 [Actinomycetota bacterium]